MSDEEKTTEQREEIEGFEGIDPEIVQRVMEEEGIEKPEAEAEAESRPESEAREEASQEQAIPQEQAQPMQIPPIQPQKITPELSESIEKAVNAGAKALTGWDDDDVDALDYMDDDDPRKTQWEHAKNLARSNVYERIRQTQAQMAMVQSRNIAEYQSALKEFNEYTSREMKDPNYKRVQEYAVGEYMKKQSASDQYTLATSYSRILNNTADPRDFMIVRTFYEQAKRSLNLGGNRVQFPRAKQVGGIASSANRRLSERELEAMIDRGEWDAIPQEYKDAMLDAYIPMR